MVNVAQVACAVSAERGGAGFGHAPVDFFNRLLELRAAALVGRRGELPLELGARQPQRLERVHAFRIAHRLGLPLHARPLHLFLALLNPRLSIDQSFARITHGVLFSCLAEIPRPASRRPFTL